MLHFVHRWIIPAALDLLPSRMDSPEARVMLLSIGLQESGFTHRRQVPVPIARGFWQFERGGGVAGVLRHDKTAQLASEACEVLRYKPDRDMAYEALADNDVLAAVFARLLLWSHPKRLPDEPEEAWRQYLQTWRPGKPHRHTWDRHYAVACDLVYQPKGD